MPGNFSRTLLAEILSSIHFRQESGTLSVRGEGVEKRILLDKGRLVFATSNAPGDEFGEMLIRIGRLAPPQLDQARKLAKPGTHLGKTLNEMGVLSPDQLHQFLELSAQEAIYPLFEWTTGEFDFKKEPFPVDSSLRLDLALPPLIFEGIRRIRKMEAVYRGLKGNETQVRLSPQFEERATEAGLDSEEAFVLSRVDACSRISEILQISPLGLEKTQKTLFGLVAVGIAELVTETARQPTAPPPAVSQAYRTFHAEVLPPDLVSSEAAEKEKNQKELEALRLEIFSMLDNLKNKNYYDLLDVPSNASSDEIKKSYYSLAKVYHPDRYHQFTEPDVKGALESIFSTLAQAYDTLKVPATRASYDAKAFKTESAAGNTVPANAAPEKATPSRSSETAHVPYQKLAQLNYQQGRGYYDHQDYWSAIQAFRQSVRFEPTVAKYRYWLAMSLSKNPKWRREAEEHFLKAIEFEQFIPSYYVGLGLLYKEVGMAKRAESQFRQALQLSPDDRTSQEALNELKMARKKKGKGFRSLVGFFKKK